MLRTEQLSCCGTRHVAYRRSGIGRVAGSRRVPRAPFPLGTFGPCDAAQLSLMSGRQPGGHPRDTHIVTCSTERSKTICLSLLPLGLGSSFASEPDRDGTDWEIGRKISAEISPRRKPKIAIVCC